jgi:hypothetical protein
MASIANSRPSEIERIGLEQPLHLQAVHDGEDRGVARGDLAVRAFTVASTPGR